MNKKLALKVTGMITSMFCMVLALLLCLAAPAKAAVEEFQIGAFFAPTWAYTNATQYDYLRDANINLIQTFYPNDLGMSTIAQMNTVLSLSSTRGIKVQSSDSRSAALMSTATNADVDAIASSYKNNPANGGYYIVDEPSAAGFPKAAQVYQRFLFTDPEAVPNVNLLPSAGVPGSYMNYLNGWVNAVGAFQLKYLTLDTYPFGAGSGISGSYFQDIANLRSAGISNNIKTAVYLQSVGLSPGLRRPNANELRWNVYTNLAYNVKGLYWFTWFQPVITGYAFTPAIMNSNGTKTDLYIPAQTLSGEVKKLGPTLMGLSSRDVYHKGSKPTGTTLVPANYFFQPTTVYDQIISHFSNDAGRSYVMVVNRDHANSRTLSFNLPSKPTAITEVSKSTGAEVSTTYSNVTGNISASFLPGEGKLYAISTDFALTPLTIDDTDLGIIYSGASWNHSSGRNVGDYSDDLHHASNNNEYFEYSFIGTGIEFISEKDPSGGNVDIYIDGVFQSTISTYGAIVHQPQQTVYSKSGLTNGPHTIKAVKKTGTFMVLDALKIYPGSMIRYTEKTNDNYTGITYSGASWTYSTGRGVGDYMNDLHVATANNDYFEYSFKGTGIDFLTETDPSGGNIDMYIDGVFQQTVSTLGTVANKSQQTVYSKSGLAYGTHTIKGIKKSGTYMLLDGFNVNKGSNLPVNPGFESGTGSWSASQGGTFAVDTVNKRSGVNGGKVTARPQLYSSPTQDVASLLTANGRGYYNLSGWVKMATGTDRAQLAIRLTDSSGTHWVSTDFKAVNSTEWTQSSKTVNINWKGKLTSAVLYVQTESTLNSFYMDDVVLTR